MSETTIEDNALVPPNSVPAGERWKIPLNGFTTLTWHSILIGEDLLIAALKKSLRRDGLYDMTDKAACNAVRNVIGELIAMLKASEDEEVRGAAEIVVTVLKKKGTGSGGEGKMMPENNPPSGGG